jgi:hypothetical protein
MKYRIGVCFVLVRFSSTSTSRPGGVEDEDEYEMPGAGRLFPRYAGSAPW